MHELYKEQHEIQYLCEAPEMPVTVPACSRKTAHISRPDRAVQTHQCMYAHHALRKPHQMSRNVALNVDVNNKGNTYIEHRKAPLPENVKQTRQGKGKQIDSKQLLGPCACLMS